MQPTPTRQSLSERQRSVMQSSWRSSDSGFIAGTYHPFQTDQDAAWSALSAAGITPERLLPQALGISEPKEKMEVEHSAWFQGSNTARVVGLRCLRGKEPLSEDESRARKRKKPGGTPSLHRPHGCLAFAEVHVGLKPRRTTFEVGAFFVEEIRGYLKHCDACMQDHDGLERPTTGRAARVAMKSEPAAAAATTPETPAAAATELEAPAAAAPKSEAAGAGMEAATAALEQRRAHIAAQERSVAEVEQDVRCMLVYLKSVLHRHSASHHGLEGFDARNNCFALKAGADADVSAAHSSAALEELAAREKGLEDMVRALREVDVALEPIVYGASGGKLGAVHGCAIIETGLAKVYAAAGGGFGGDGATSASNDDSSPTTREERQLPREMHQGRVVRVHREGGSE